MGIIQLAERTPSSGGPAFASGLCHFIIGISINYNHLKKTNYGYLKLASH